MDRLIKKEEERKYVTKIIGLPNCRVFILSPHKYGRLLYRQSEFTGTYRDICCASDSDNKALHFQNVKFNIIFPGL
jgi:hypothetical protein